MSVKSWDGRSGFFQSPHDWSPNEAPAAGDSLYISSGLSMIFNDTYGSPDARSSIALVGMNADSAPQLVALNVTFTNVVIDNAPPTYTGPDDQRPADYFAPRYGSIFVIGTVINDGGEIIAGRANYYLGIGNLDVTIAPGSTLINQGSLTATPQSALRIIAYDNSTLENDQRISANGGRITIGAHLTGTGDVSATGGLIGTGEVELQAAVDAGQTFHLSRGVLQVDQPFSFMGQVDISQKQSGERVTLEGITAASWDTNGNTVELFDAGGAIVDTLQFTKPQDLALLQYRSFRVQKLHITDRVFWDRQRWRVFLLAFRPAFV